MSAKDYADDLSATVHYALEITRAVAVCPFHSELTICVDDDAAESHAFERAKRIVRSDGTNWETQDLREEIPTCGWGRLNLRCIVQPGPQP